MKNLLRRFSASVHALTAGLLLMAGLFLPDTASLAGSAADSSPAVIVVLDRNQAAVGKITDGDQIRIRINTIGSVSTPLMVEFILDGGRDPIGTSAIPGGTNTCQTEPLASRGWYWTAGGQAKNNRTIQATIGGSPIGSGVTIQVAPRPVVMVHGFSSSWVAWQNYLGPDGFLAKTGLHGFAVGDGQEPGALNTGDFSAPAQRTNTIAENAAILGEYITSVKKATGAQEVDLISHSMGGLIARYYIDRVMQERDVAQLIMLGSPMAGTDCAALPAALGLYLPASLELRPSYVQGIFDQQITHRHGVPFHALAGVPILEAFQSPCTGVPSDLAVSYDSVTAIPLEATRLPILHMNLNLSATVFSDYVRPLLQTPAGGYPEEADPLQPALNPSTLRFTRIYTGHIDLGASQEITIRIDQGVTVASFALYDTTRSLAVSVRGASGNVIVLSAEKNGLVVVKDPSTLFYLGYGFQNPKPGLWRVSLAATDKTPAGGADYAMTAYFVGGAELRAQTNTLIPRVGEPVQFSVALNLGAQALNIETAQALIHGPDGNTQTVDMVVNGAQAAAGWKPAEPGLYGVDIRVTGASPDNTPIERTAFLSLETQPKAGISQVTLIFILAAVLVLFLLIVGAVWLIWRKVRRGRTA